MYMTDPFTCTCTCMPYHMQGSMKLEDRELEDAELGDGAVEC